MRDGLVVRDLGALHRVFPRVIRNTVGGTLRDSQLCRDLGEFHGERVDVSDTTPIQVAGAGMMLGVSTSPSIVRGECDHPENASTPVIGASRVEE